MYDSHVILNNIGQLRGGGESGIHFATVCIFGRMTGKNRYFCDLSQHVLFKVVLYLVFLICVVSGCEDKRRIWLMIKSHF